jgi:hypothetical protein
VKEGKKRKGKKDKSKRISEVRGRNMAKERELGRKRVRVRESASV